ncbi:Arb2 domain-containing protein [Powellomyces hirtus]|nr:Arb2 domain-containing protein [Powellomyces hirtus]
MNRFSPLIRLPKMGSMPTYISKDIPSFPSTLSEFGYTFNELGQLRSIESGEPFKFEVRPGSRAYNQAHYEALGDVIGEHIETELGRDHGLVRIEIPVDAKENEATSKIMMTPNALTSEAPLLLLLPGIRVSLGQWARSIIINDNINNGSVYSYLRHAKQMGYECLVFNSNENASEKRRIRGSANPQQHVEYVWKHLVRKAVSKRIGIVAHSFGGVCTLHLLKSCEAEFCERVAGIAFTDSVHEARSLNKDQRSWLQKHAVNWVTSDEPLDTPVAWNQARDGCPLRSAGHVKHEYTTVTAQASVFNFLDARLTPQTETRSSDEAGTSPNTECRAK